MEYSIGLQMVNLKIILLYIYRTKLSKLSDWLLATEKLGKKGEDIVSEAIGP